MKLFKSSILFLVLCISMGSCSKNPVNNDYVGHWEITSYESNSEIYERVDALPSDNYGFSIIKDGTFVENKNAGWCGTPPICYDRFGGSWESVSENMLELNTSNWSETNIIFNFEILSVSGDQMEIVRTIP